MQVDFETKKKMLFECLESAEKSLEGSTLAQTNRDYSFLHNRQQRKRGRDEQVEKFKHKDSLFKRPDLPINKCLRSRQRPDHEKNPNKYKHYTLDDVSDTSDRMNTTAAFSFLKEIEERRQPDSQMDDDESGSSQKIVFKKSIKLRPKNDEIDPQLSGKKIQSNKIVMPEYVVGEKRTKPKKDPKPKDRQASSSASLRLSHLDEEEDET